MHRNARALLAVVGSLLCGQGAAAHGATLEVPTDAPTIQQAVDAAGPGDVIRVRPGTYQEAIRIEGERAGLTIEAADPRNPPLILGTRNASLDGIRVERVDGIRLRHLDVQGAYNGVRLNRVHGALLANLRITDSALAVRFYRGSDNALVWSIIAVTRVEEGVRVDSSPRALLTDNVVERCDGGIHVLGSPGALLVRNRLVDNAGDGLRVYRSDRTRIQSCTARGNAGNGLRVTASSALTLVGNVAEANRDVGVRVERSPPFASVADVTTTGNRARGNGNRDVVVLQLGCNTTGCQTTTSTSPKSTTTSTSLPSSGETPARWRFYARIVTRAGTSRNVDVPSPVSSPALEVAIRTDQLAAFRIGDQVIDLEIAALGADTATRLRVAVDAYLRAHRDRYPDFAALGNLRWAMRIGP